MKRCNWSRGKKNRRKRSSTFTIPFSFLLSFLSHTFFSNITTAVESLNVTFLLKIRVFEFDNSDINSKWVSVETTEFLLDPPLPYDTIKSLPKAQYCLYWG